MGYFVTSNDGRIYNDQQLLKLLGKARGIDQLIRTSDLDEWNADKAIPFSIHALQPDTPPTTDIVNKTGFADQGDDGLWYRRYESRAYSMNEKRLLISDRRDEAINAGIIYKGVSIKTDSESQGYIAGAALQALLDPTYVITNWKVGPGTFVTLDASAITEVAVAVRTHVQSCFDREADLLSMTDPQSGDPIEPSIDDIQSGWPA